MGQIERIRRMPLLGEVCLLVVKRCERPGMALHPSIGVCEPSLDDGIWIEIGPPKFIHRLWVPLALIAQQ